MKVSGLKRVARNVSNLAAAQYFYTEALGFTQLGAPREAPELAALLGAEEVQRLRLVSGRREIELTQCFPLGDLHPRGDANLVSFQHIALLTSDIEAAWRKVVALGAEPISERPVQLPGGIIAAKFRDPEGHPLEFIQRPVLGYDHSAISVSDAARSMAFYSELGVQLAARQVNRGPEQAVLDGLAAPELDVVTLRPEEPHPHVELLGYRSPAAQAVQWGLTDICADRLVFAAEATRLLRDPDGHVLLLEAGASGA